MQSLSTTSFFSITENDLLSKVYLKTKHKKEISKNLDPSGQNETPVRKMSIQKNIQGYRKIVEAYWAHVFSEQKWGHKIFGTRKAHCLA